MSGYLYTKYLMREFFKGKVVLNGIVKKCSNCTDFIPTLYIGNVSNLPQKKWGHFLIYAPEIQRRSFVLRHLAQAIDI